MFGIGMLPEMRKYDPKDWISNVFNNKSLVLIIARSESFRKVKKVSLSAFHDIIICFKV